MTTNTPTSPTDELKENFVKIVAFGRQEGKTAGEVGEELAELFDQELDKRINDDKELAASKYWLSKAAYQELYKLQQLSNYVEWTNPKFRRVIATRMSKLHSPTQLKGDNNEKE